MKIKKILSQHRRDFTATLVCEHCEHEEELKTGYDDANYHQNVIPRMKCSKCGKTALKDTKPREPKYPPGQVV